MAALSSLEPVMSLVGPRGCGKSAALAAWAAQRRNVTWVDNSAAIPTDPGYLVVDDAEALDDETWERLRRCVTTSSSAYVRIAARSASALPEQWRRETHDGLFLDIAEISELLASYGSAADSAVVYAVTRGHGESVRLIARARVTSHRRMLETLAASTTITLPGAFDAALATPMHLTSKLVSQLGHDPDLLDQAEREGFGRWTGSPDSPVFQLIPTVRSHVRARSTIDRARRLEIRAIAADDLHDHRAFIEAFIEAIAAQRMDLAEREIMSGGLSLLTAHAPEITALLRGVPMARLTAHPVVAAALGLVMHDQRNRRATASEVARMAAASLVGVSAAAISRHRPAYRMLLKALEGSCGRFINVGDAGVGAARQAAVMIEELSVADSEDLGAIRGLAHSNISMTLLLAGHLDEARIQAARGLDVPTGSAEGVLATGLLAMSDVLSGRFTQARATLAGAEHTRPATPALDTHAGDFLRIATAWEAVERGDLAHASDVMRRLWSSIDTIEHWPMVLHLQALIDIESGRAIEGLERFRTVRQSSSSRFQHRQKLNLVEITESLLLLASGNAAEAVNVIAPPFNDVGRMLAAARAALVVGNDTRVLELLGSTTARHPVDVVTAEALKAAVLSQAGRSDEALSSARRARSIAAAHGLRTPLMLMPASLDLFGQNSGHICLLPPYHRAPTLSGRERLVLAELRRSSSAVEIAHTLHVSVNTIKAQRRMIYRKLSVSTREEALAKALALGLLGD